MSDTEDPFDHPVAAVPAIADMHLDLTKDEKLRSAALLMGIKYYTDTIIKDARYLEVMIAREKEMSFSNAENKADWQLRPANVEGVIRCASWFEAFLLGKMPQFEITWGGEKVEPRATEGAADTSR